MQNFIFAALALKERVIVQNARTFRVRKSVEKAKYEIYANLDQILIVTSRCSRNFVL